MAERMPITEEQLEALKAEAALTGRVKNRGIVPISGPFPNSATLSGYHGNPVLKPPTWTWQVPLYFFVGGIAGISSVIAVFARASANYDLARASSWVALGGGIISAPLLIADLGRPSRFLNMLRVFKVRSTMSVGAWTLSVFSSAAALTLILSELNLAGLSSPTGIGWFVQILAALTGLILASYTSVLLTVTAIPVWSENRKLVPAVFVTGALGSAVAVLELLGFKIAATQFIGIVASIIEIVVAILIEVRRREVDRPLLEGFAGRLVRAGAVLSGPASLMIRMIWSHTSYGRYSAALLFALGALITRYGWLAAGRMSAQDPQALFNIQRNSTR